MKFLVVIFAAIATVYAATCDTTKLSPLLNEPYTSQCTTAADYTFVSLTVPNTAVLAKMCTIPSCVEFFMAIGALNLGNCTVGTLNVQDAVDTFESICGIESSSDSNISSENTTVADANTGSNSSTDSSTTIPSTRTVTSGASSIAYALSSMLCTTPFISLCVLFH